MPRIRKSENKDMKVEKVPGLRKRRRRTDEKVDVYVPGPLEVDGQLISHNVWVDGHRTSLRLEAVMWKALRMIGEREDKDLHELVTLISYRQHPDSSLTATVRAFLLAYFLHVAPENTPPILNQMLSEDILRRLKPKKRQF